MVRLVLYQRVFSFLCPKTNLTMRFETQSPIAIVCVLLLLNSCVISVLSISQPKRVLFRSICVLCYIYFMCYIYVVCMYMSVTYTICYTYVMCMYIYMCVLCHVYVYVTYMSYMHVHIERVCSRSITKDALPSDHEQDATYFCFSFFIFHFFLHTIPLLFPHTRYTGKGVQQTFFKHAFPATTDTHGSSCFSKKPVSSSCLL